MGCWRKGGLDEGGDNFIPLLPHYFLHPPCPFVGINKNDRLYCYVLVAGIARYNVQLRVERRSTVCACASKVGMGCEGRDKMRQAEME